MSAKPKYRRLKPGEPIPAGCEIAGRGRHRDWTPVNPAAVGRKAGNWLLYRVRIN